MSINTFRFDIVLLELGLEMASEQDLLEKITLLSNEEDCDKVESLQSIHNFMITKLNYKIDTSVINTLLQYTLNLCVSKNHDVRFYSVKALISMLDDRTSGVILTQLSKIMDDDSGQIKSLILNNYDKLKVYDKKISNLLLKKGKVDSHFVVRQKAVEVQ